MEIHQYLENKKNLQNILQIYIERDKNIEENYQNLIKIFHELKILHDSSELQSFIYLLLKISNNFNRSTNFYSKIEKIILFIKDSIQQQFTNYQIFNIFKSNKRLLLFLFKEKILNPEKSILLTLQQKRFKKFNYISYLYTEIKPLIKRHEQNYIENYEENRLIGENEDLVCQLIRNDSIDQFISMAKKRLFQLKTVVKPSIFETNHFLLKNQPTLIEYSAFFGSMQIFKYLYLNGAEVKPSIWLYAIHGRNPEMINYLEQNKINPDDCSFKECLKESIKCHHNEIFNYIQSNFLNGPIENEFNVSSIKYYNYEYFPTDINNDTIFYYLCCYNYINLVKFLLKTTKINLNTKIILNMHFSYDDIFFLNFFK